MGLKNMKEVMTVVGEGRLEQAGKHHWICSVCLRRIGPYSNGYDRDQSAVRHCLVHASFDSTGDRALFDSRSREGAGPDTQV